MSDVEADDDDLQLFVMFCGRLLHLQLYISDKKNDIAAMMIMQN